MSVMVLLILASIFVAGLFLFGFLWALKNGQYDDAEGPAVRILFDDGTISPPASDEEEKTEEEI
ncbi:MAG: cbb3-type cytochrome oxidase assembly protein CcoS [Saprospirales bacterium]|nr:MAG: cbb3-type cytochrome oxidase assembly protein CcoS [Saprospirales bacterium]